MRRTTGRSRQERRVPQHCNHELPEQVHFACLLISGNLTIAIAKLNRLPQQYPPHLRNIEGDLLADTEGNVTSDLPLNDGGARGCICCVRPPVDIGRIFQSIHCYHENHICRSCRATPAASLSTSAS